MTNENFILRMQSFGLKCLMNDLTCLSVYATETPLADGAVHGTLDLVKLFRFARQSDWLAYFPGPSRDERYFLVGSLEILSEQLERVYSDYLERGGSLSDAFARTIPDASTHLTHQDYLFLYRDERRSETRI